MQEKDDDSWSVLFNKAVTLKKERKYKEAITCYERLLDKRMLSDLIPQIKDRRLQAEFERMGPGLNDVNKALIYEEIGLCHAMLDDYKNALIAFEFSIKFGPRNGRALYDAALASLKLCNYGKAIDYAITAGSYASEKTRVAEYDIKKVLAQAYSFSGDIRSAVTVLEELSRKCKLDYTLTIILADAYAKLTQYNLAEEYFKRALELEPNDSYSLDYLGHIYNKTGHPEEAVEYGKKAMVASPKDPHIYHNLACYYAVLKDKKNAIEFLKKAIEMGWSDYDSTMNDHDFDSIRNLEEFKELTARIKQSSKVTSNRVDEI